MAGPKIPEINIEGYSANKIALFGEEDFKEIYTRLAAASRLPSYGAMGESKLPSQFTKDEKLQMVLIFVRELIRKREGQLTLEEKVMNGEHDTTIFPIMQVVGLASPKKELYQLNNEQREEMRNIFFDYFVKCTKNFIKK